MGKQQAPAPPDPVATAASQTASNKETAIAQSNLNMVDQVGPGGSVKYTQIGTNSDGTPKYQQTTAYDPKTEGIYNAGIGTSQNLANLAQQKSGELGGLLANPIDFSAQKQYLEGLTSGALDKSWAQNQAALDTKLSNQGIKLGSDAYDRAQNQFGVTRSDAYNSANVNNYNTALQSQMALRSAPINEILALSGQSQVQQPQFSATPQTGVAGTDIAGLTNQGYQNQVAAINANNAGTGAMLGGLFGAGANLLGAPSTSILGKMFSDKRLKTDIRDTGEEVAGVPVKSWRWKGSDQRDTGVIAQELERKHPGLVSRDPKTDMRMVNYGGLLKMGARR